MFADGAASLTGSLSCDAFSGRPIAGLLSSAALAAKRARIKEIILCEDNRKDIDEIKEEYRKGLTFHYVTDMSEVIEIAITNQKVKNAKKL